MKKILDERQVLVELRVTKIAFWVMWMLLMVDVAAKMFILATPFYQYITELAVFLAGSLIMAIGLPKGGIWDNRRRPTMKNYFLFSGVGTLVFSILFVIGRYRNSDYFRANPGDAVLITLITAASVFVCMFLALAFSGHYVKKQEKREVRELDEDEE